MMFHLSLSTETLWFCIGFLGQSLFFMRFFVQWLASEKMRKSIIPHMFWYFSLGGGLILFIYSFHRHDPVFVIGQSTGLFIYARNIYFIRKEKHALAAE